MQTRKLYYEDCHLSHFSGVVLSCEETEKGFEIILDATAFYPEGGGQAADTGTIGTVRVKDTRERGDAVVHLCDGPLTPGARVEGMIDYEKRFQRMQQHTGEHIVSGIIHRRYGFHNTGFHMGGDCTTIDFDGVIPLEELPQIEAEANRAVWANLTVKCWTPSAQELPHVFYRTKKALQWPVRIVQVPGFDSCACCGVHVAATGEIGPIKLLSAIGFRGGTRMELVCGIQAFSLMNAAFEQNRLVSQAFSAKILETGSAAKRINELLTQQKYRIAELERQINKGIAERYVNQENVLHFADHLEPLAVRELADAIAETCGGTAAVFSGTDETGYSFCLASRTEDLRPFGKAMTQALSGRGGGKPGFQQGQVKASRADIEEFLRDF